MEVLTETVYLIHHYLNVLLIMGSVPMDSSKTKTVTASLNMVDALKVIIVMKTMRQVDVFQIQLHANLAI